MWQRWLERCAYSSAARSASRTALLILARIPGLAFFSYHSVGQLYAAAGNARAAVQFYDQALACPRIADPTIYHHRGVALAVLHRQGEAEANFLQSIAFKPWAWWSYKALGQTMLKLGRWQEAQAYFERVLSLHGTDPWSHYHLFEAQRLTSGRALALENWLDRVLAAPPMPELHVRVGLLWTEDFEPTSAQLDKLQQVSDRYPDCLEVGYVWGCLLGRAGRTAEATERLRDFMRRAWQQSQALPGEPSAPIKDPEFVIIGLAKSGSTALYDYLVDHPLVCPAVVKEVYFWDRHHDYGWEWYRSCFMPIPATAPQITGDGSVTSLWHGDAPRRVFEFREDMKLLVILRDPVARAYSDYHMRKRLGHDLAPWETLVQEEMDRYPRCPLTPDELPLSDVTEGLLMQGAALPLLKRWRRHFPARQFLVLRNEDLSVDVQRTVNAAYAFLGLPPHQLTTTTRRNVGEYPPMSSELAQTLREWYRPHQEALERFLATEMA